MPSSWVLTLDTTAPVVTWGAVDGAAITEVFTVQYLLDEPEIVSAELELAGGRRIPLTVEPTQLTTVMPDDAFEGWGRVLAYVRDDVNNTATRELAVYVSGIIPPTPAIPVQPPAGGLPGQATGPEIKSFGPTRARGRDAFTVSVALSSTSRVRSHSRYSRPEVEWRVFTERLYLASSYTTGVRLPSAASAGKLRSEGRVIRRGEGPDATAELIALGLL